MTRTHIALALTAALAPSAALAQPVQNHLTCFAIKDSAPPAKYQVNVTNAAGSQRCTVRTPARIACVAAAATSISPVPPGGGPAGSEAGAFLCYRAKCAPPSSSTNVEDEFGRRVIKFRAARFVCAPSDLNAPPPGESSTTTTLLGGGNPCRFQNGECRGTCAPGSRCGAAVGSGSCECRNVVCGDASAPECNGACPSAGEACIFDVTGCSCVDIP